MAFGNNTAQIKAVITAEDRASPTLKKFGGNAGKAFSSLSTLVTGAAVVAFGKASVKAYSDSQQALAQLDAVLKSTGGAAKFTREEAIKLSKEIQNTTSLSDEDALAVENMGLTFTKIGRDIFPQSTKAAIDMATALNHGLKPSGEQAAGAMKLLGKALQDPDAGLGALHRAGVNTEELKKKFEGVTDAGVKQKLLLQELGKEFGGSATAQAKTFAGQMDQMKNKFNDLQESIGKTLTEALLPMMKFLAAHPAVVKAMTFAVLGLATAFLAVKTASGISGALGAVSQFTKFIKAGGTLGAVTGYGLVIAGLAADAVLVFKAFQSVKGAIKDVNNAYNAANKSTENADTVAVIKGLKNTIAHGNAAQRKRAQAQLKDLNSGGGYLATPHASGGPVMSGGSYLVGEKGPELFTPTSGGSITPNNKMGGASTINITVQAGAYMGSQQDARRYAQMILSAIGDIASSKNKSVNQLLGIA